VFEACRGDIKERKQRRKLEHKIEVTKIICIRVKRAMPCFL
jgi:hypothetical protein